MVLFTGAPFASDLTTTVLRLVTAVLDTGATARVWACGYATTLTQRSLGRRKPANLRDWDRGYPSTAGIVGDLLRSYGGRLTWEVCRFCSEDRGAVGHIDEVRVRSPLRMGALVAAAATVVYIGGA
jgi:hypothetical protein